METVIVICLLIIIVLLLQDKIVIKKYPEQKPVQEKSNLILPDIMGQPKPQRGLAVPMSTNESQKLEQEHQAYSFSFLSNHHFFISSKCLISIGLEAL